MMMQNKIQLIVVLAGILSKASCDLYRIVLIEEPKNWTEAQSYCREMYMDLATVQTDEDRAKLKEAANAVNFTSDAWIGFYRDGWRWSYQHTPVSNAKWGFSQPDLPNKYMVCGKLNSKGRWGDRYCINQHHFFCQTDKQDTLQNKFKCIDSMKLNWTDALTYCRTHYTDLAAIKDDAENEFLANELSSQNLSDAWIGLYRIPLRWLWSDKTGVSWSSVKWESGWLENVTENQCAKASTKALMAEDTCSTPLPFYCRENRRMQRVRFTVQSDGHLDQSTVKEAIEKKMKQILSDQDMKIRSSITWSIQPDGKIFQWQKKQENTQETACEVLHPVKR